MFPHMKEVPAHFRSPSPNLKVFKLSDLKKATNNFSPNLILGEGGFWKVFFGWVEENTLAPSKQGVGMVVAVKRLKKKSSQGSTDCQIEHEWSPYVLFPEQNDVEPVLDKKTVDSLS
ncbi:hypothetical protein E3N88_41616 [Mikania micrantha]|uniref:Protein kinase domain-containing protein n=1 Tax=Mikania micrantha TaxID=192012 RepID=A0A5N6LK38_9ASTR|nr:hypothetical protein E3N88_41616 [Mikania micrantha]